MGRAGWSSPSAGHPFAVRRRERWMIILLPEPYAWSEDPAAAKQKPDECRSLLDQDCDPAL